MSAKKKRDTRALGEGNHFSREQRERPPRSIHLAVARSQLTEEFRLSKPSARNYDRLIIREWSGSVVRRKRKGHARERGREEGREKGWGGGEKKEKEIEGRTIKPDCSREKKCRQTYETSCTRLN